MPDGSLQLGARELLCHVRRTETKGSCLLSPLFLLMWIFFGPILGLSDPAPTKPEAIKASLTLSQYQFSVCLKQKYMQICGTQ